MNEDSGTKELHPLAPQPFTCTPSNTSSAREIFGTENKNDNINKFIKYILVSPENPKIPIF
jgi:hypothetical protein